MNLHEIENAIAKNTKKDLIELAKKLNTVIDDFANEKGLNCSYIYFKNEDRVIEKLDNYEATLSPNGEPYFEFNSVRNSKYENSLGDVEKYFFAMLEKTFFESLHKKKVANLIKKASLLDD